MSGDGPLRVGRISALNMYPIYHHLAASADPAMAFTDGLPTTLNGALLEDRLDVSAVSHRLRAQRRPAAPAAGGLDRRLGGGRLDPPVLARAVRGPRSVAVTRHSATSIALLRILLGPGVPFEPLEGEPAAALERVDGVLLIADEALHRLLNPFCAHSADLGELWRRRTGRPMVFAVWAARLDAAERRPEGMAELSALLLRGPGSLRGRPRGGGAPPPPGTSRSRPGSSARTSGACATASARPAGRARPLLRAGQGGRRAGRPAASGRVGLAAMSTVAPALDHLEVLERADAGERLSDEDVLALLASRDLLRVGAAAARARARQSDDGEVTYIVDRNVNYTNVCIDELPLLRLLPPVGIPRATCSARILGQKLEEMMDARRRRASSCRAASTRTFRIEWYEDLFRWIKASTRLELHALSPAGDRPPAASRRALAARRRSSGCTRPGSTRSPAAAPRSWSTACGQDRQAECTSDEWLDVMRAAHPWACPPRATMMYGTVRHLEDRIEHLRRLREVQDERGGFTGLRLLELPARRRQRPRRRPRAHDRRRLPDDAGGRRLYLDNFPHFQSSWVTQGLRVGQLAWASAATTWARS